MKLLHFQLEDYRVLHQLSVPFVKDAVEESTNISNNQHTLSFLVGVNGSGKSTFLRALLEVFRKLPTNQPIAFGFELEYLLDTGTGPQKISIVNKPGYSRPQTFLNDESEERSFSEAFLPRRIIVLTTGTEDDWEKQETLLTAEPEASLAEALKELDLDRMQLAIQELPGKPIQPINLELLDRNIDDAEEDRFLFIRSKYLPIVTLCGQLTDLTTPERLLDGVLNEAQIESMRGFSLKFRMNSGTTSPTTRGYIEHLKEVATRRLRMGSDYLLVFDFPSQDAGYASQILKSAVREGTDIQPVARGLYFYEQLVRLYDPPANTLPVLQEINIFFKRMKKQSG